MTGSSPRSRWTPSPWRGPRPTRHRRAVHRPGVRRRPRPRLGRPRCDGRSGRPRRDGPEPAAARGDLVPADRGDRAARCAGGVRRGTSRAGRRGHRPTAPSRSGSTWRARSSPRRATAPTTRPSCVEPADVARRRSRAAPRRPAAPDARAGAARRAGAHSAAAGPRDRRLDRALRGDARQARAGYAAGATSTTHLFNAMSGVDHRAPGVARRGVARRRRLRRAHRRRHPRPSGALGAHHPAQAGRPPGPRQRRPLARGDRRRARTDRRARGGRRRGPGHARGDDHARGIGHRPRHGRAEPRRARGPRSRPPSPRRHATRWRCSGSRTAVGSPSAAARTSSSSMTTSTSAGSCAAATGSSRPPDDPGGQPTCVSERAGMGTDPGTARSARPPRMPVRELLAGTPHGRRRPLVDR